MRDLLMIDDDEKLLTLVREYLEPHGFAVRAAYDGPSGIESALTSSPDLVILDLMLPGMDGLEVCRRIRQESTLPILMLTARGDETDRIVGLELGADDYLPKPFNPRELLARIRAILRRTEIDRDGVMASILSVGPVSLNPEARSVTVEGRLVDLTTAEFDLLHALMANAGRVLARERLIELVHGPGWSAYDRSIDVHVSRIRQKIEAHPKKPELVKTVRGAGYQFVKTEENR